MDVAKTAKLHAKVRANPHALDVHLIAHHHVMVVVVTDAMDARIRAWDSALIAVLTDVWDSALVVANRAHPIAVVALEAVVCDARSTAALDVVMTVWIAVANRV